MTPPVSFDPISLKAKPCKTITERMPPTARFMISLASHNLGEKGMTVTAYMLLHGATSIEIWWGLVNRNCKTGFAVTQMP